MAVTVGAIFVELMDRSSPCKACSAPAASWSYQHAAGTPFCQIPILIQNALQTPGKPLIAAHSGVGNKGSLLQCVVQVCGGKLGNHLVTRIPKYHRICLVLHVPSHDERNAYAMLVAGHLLAVIAFWSAASLF